MSVLEEKGEKKLIYLSSDLIARLENRVAHTDEFSSVDKYIEHVLTRVLDILEERFPSNTSSHARESSMRPDEEEKIQKRLEDLGYM